MRIYQSRTFENKVKKLSNHEKELLDDEIKKIVENPLIGEEKKGDLKAVHVHNLPVQSSPLCSHTKPWYFIMIGVIEDDFLEDGVIISIQEKIGKA